MLLNDKVESERQRKQNANKKTNKKIKKNK